MKQIIDGKLYDTEAATFHCSHWNGKHWQDFNHREDELYETAKGALFFVRYVYGSDFSGRKSFIEVPDREEADRFAQTYMDADEYQLSFGEVDAA